MISQPRTKKAVSFADDVGVKKPNKKKAKTLHNFENASHKAHHDDVAAGSYTPPDPRILNPPQPVLDAKTNFPMMTIEDAKILAMASEKRNTSSCQPDLDDTDTTNEVNEESSSIVNDADALQRHLDIISYKCGENIKRVPWIETLNICLNMHVNKEDTIEASEDFRRESRFAELTNVGTVEALKRLQIIGLPFTRPKDFYAEMLKTDDHMYRVQTKLAKEEAKVTAIEARKKHRVEKKFAKKVQTERIKQKQEQKKKNVKSIEDWKRSKYKTNLS